MPKKKTFLVPVYIIGFSILIGAAFEGPTVMSVMRNEHSTNDPFANNLRMSFINKLINSGIIYMVILTECAVYWIMREKNFRKDFAIGHSIAVALALVGLPIGFLIYSYFIDLSIPSDETARTIRVMNALDSGLFKVFLVVAHICFALVLVSVWKNRKDKPVEIIAAEGDLLNEYADQ